jgi:hypothetical protein
MIRALTFFAACLGTCWLLLASASPTRHPTEPAGPAAATVPPRSPETRVASLSGDAHAESAPANPDGLDDTTSSSLAASQDVAGPKGAAPDIGHLAAPIPYVAKRLGLSSQDARTAFLSGWLADRRAEEHRLIERVSQLGGSAQREAMLAFNAAGDAWRRLLMQQVGYDLATQVVDTFCMYRFEPSEGTWHRVSAVGERVPFLHEDDDIWQRGECSDPRWEGHW